MEDIINNVVITIISTFILKLLFSIFKYIKKIITLCIHKIKAKKHSYWRKGTFAFEVKLNFTFKKN